jgi:hypothetical protein
VQTCRTLSPALLSGSFWRPALLLLSQLPTRLCRIAVLIFRFAFAPRTSTTRANVASTCQSALPFGFSARQRVTRHPSFCPIRVRAARAAYQIPGFLLVPISSSAWIALLSLGHPLGAHPAPLRDFAALLFRFLPEEISRAKSGAASARFRARFLPAPSQKAPLALGSRAPRVALRRGVRSEIRAIQIRRTTICHCMKTLSN